MLAYTGNDGSIMSKAPPTMGAIIPPLSVNKCQKKSTRRTSRKGTHTRESAEAAPQAVPRTDEGMYEFIKPALRDKIRNLSQLTTRGKYLGRPA